MIKIFACLFMLIDHIGAVFFPQNEMLRLIGRLSMPMFAYGIAIGIKKTHDLKRYFMRVLIIAIISQPFHHYLFDYKLNICFEWAVAIALLYFTMQRKTILCGAVLIVSIIAPISYGIYGIGYVIMYYIINEYKLKMPVQYGIWGLLHILYILTDTSGVVQLFTLPSIAVIDMLAQYENDKTFKIQKNIAVRFFYPVHLIIITIIAIFIQLQRN